MKFPRYWVPTSCGVLPISYFNEFLQKHYKPDTLITSLPRWGKWGSERSNLASKKLHQDLNSGLCDSKADTGISLRGDFSSPDPVYSPLPASLPKESPGSLTSFMVGSSLLPEAAFSISGFLGSCTKVFLPATTPRLSCSCFPESLWLFSLPQGFLCSRLMAPASLNHHLTLNRKRIINTIPLYRWGNRDPEKAKCTPGKVLRWRQVANMGLGCLRNKWQGGRRQVCKAWGGGWGWGAGSAGLHLQFETKPLKLLTPKCQIYPFALLPTGYRCQPGVGIHRKSRCLLWGLVEVKPSEAQVHQPRPRSAMERGLVLAKGLSACGPFLFL